jgi:acyl-CoA synthetase (NDP forming)
MDWLNALLAPRSVAIVGASADKRKIRGRLLATLVGAGYAGKIFPVSASSTEVQGLKAYASLRDIGEPLDLAMIAVPAAQVGTVLDDCEAVGVGAVIVHSSGPAAQDEPGADIGERISRFVGRTGIRVLGPNSEGIYNVAGRVAANFAPVVGTGGDAALADAGGAVSLVSQSGAIGFALYARGTAEGLAFRHVITTGNEIDLECLEIVEALVAEGRSSAIMMFIEGFSRPERFIGVARRAAEAKIPLVVMKVGSSEAGQRAALSHTAHLAGDDAAYNAVFDQYGVIRVGDIEEMLGVTSVLARGNHAAGRAVAIATTTGGAGGWASDLCSAAGLSVPPLAPATRARLDQIVPAYGSTANPVDITAQALEDGGASLVGVLREIEADISLNGAMVMMNMASAGRIAGLEPTLAPLLRDMRKPVVFHSPSPPAFENVAALARLGAPYASMRGATLGLAASARYGAFLQRAGNLSASGSPATGVDTAVPTGGASLGRWLGESGIVMAGEAFAQTADAAAAAAAALGFPVVMKIASPDIQHKTEARGVLLGLTDETAVAAGFDTVVGNARAYLPTARIDGVQIQKMMPPGIEMVVGMVRDRDFGPVLMLGLGGVLVEVIKDVAFAPVPVDRDAARRMIDRLKGKAILHGVRGKPPADIEALVDLLMNVSRLIEQAGDGIVEIDLNPVILYPEGQGYAVVDALIVGKED